MGKDKDEQKREDLKIEIDRLLFAAKCSPYYRTRFKIMNAADRVAGELRKLTNWGKK